MSITDEEATWLEEQLEKYRNKSGAGGSPYLEQRSESAQPQLPKVVQIMGRVFTEGVSNENSYEIHELVCLLSDGSLWVEGQEGWREIEAPPPCRKGEEL